MKFIKNYFVKKVSREKFSMFYIKIERDFCINYIKFLYNLYKMYKNKRIPKMVSFIYYSLIKGSRSSSSPKVKFKESSSSKEK